MQTDKRRLFFFGIGGIGMSALARLFRHQGHHVAGYDRTANRMVRALQAEGIPVTQADSSFDTNAWDEVIYTPAIPAELPAFQQAQSSGLPLRKRAEVVGELTRHYHSLAVAGTHGKTSTSALLADLLKSAGLEPGALIGGVLRQQQTNFLAPGDELLVVEADEYDRSFLHFRPQAAIITATDADHLDVYDTAHNLRAAYAEFAALLPAGGLLLLNDQAELPSLPSHAEVLRYGLQDSSAYAAQNLREEALATRFDLRTPEGLFADWRLPLPGRYNLENATGALAMALRQGADPTKLREALADYSGVERRYEIILQQNDLILIDDYAHHPTELDAVLNTTRQRFPRHKLVVVFQPHLYSRTRDFEAGFVRSLVAADEVFLVHIYPARELSIPHVSSNSIYQQITLSRKHLLTLKQIPEQVPKAVDGPSVILILGAGDIDTMVEPLRQQLVHTSP